MIGWSYQAQSVSAANGNPNLDSDGVLVHPSPRCHGIAYVTANQGDWLISYRFWIQRAGVWGIITDLDYWCCTEATQYSVHFDPPVWYAERAYIEICEITGGEGDDPTVDLIIGNSGPYKNEQ